jgi:hypothetical protein
MQTCALRKSRSTRGQFHRGSPLQVLFLAASERDFLNAKTSSHFSRFVELLVICMSPPSHSNATTPAGEAPERLREEFEPADPLSRRLLYTCLHQSQLSWNMDRFCFKLAMMTRRAFLDPSSTSTAVKNVFRHVTDVLQLEFKRSTAIGPELSKEIILHVAVYDI